MISWELENIVKSSQENPESFFIPSKLERDNQKVGDLVRLHFILKNPENDEPRAERMWVKITKKKTIFSNYKGVLDNEPLYIKDLKMNDEIQFDSSNIARVLIDENDPNWVDSLEKNALLSKRCLEKNAVIRFLYREKPDNEEDSGWRMFTGLESEEYNNDPNNIRIVNIGFMLDKDPSLLVPLKEGTGSVFERENKKKPWEKVTDWYPEE